MGQNTCGTGVCLRGVPVCKDGEFNNEDCVEGVPASSETCNELDDDCDGATDEDWQYKGTGCVVMTDTVCQASGIMVCKADGTDLECNAVAGQATGDDNDCNGLDNNCNGQKDENYAPQVTTCGQGVCAAEGLTSCVPASCVPNEGGGGCTIVPAHVADSCVDGDPLYVLDNTCDGVDDNCSGLADEDYVSLPTTCGQGVCANTGVTSCVGGHVLDSCQLLASTGDDTNCNGEDENCDGTADEGYQAPTTACGTGVCASTGLMTCVNGGLVDTCLPGPAGVEACNGLDDNCNDLIDEEGALGCQTYYADWDQDSYGTSDSRCWCAPSFIYTAANSLDCNDMNAAIHPGATEVCNGLDDDCNNEVDEDVLSIFFEDSDSDTYGNRSMWLMACSVPQGYVTDDADCDDTRSNVHPGAAETCDGLDNDCDTETDEGVQSLFYRDADGDNYGNVSITASACATPTGFVNNSTDCNDESAAIHPGATELCNSLDDNCNGQTDELWSDVLGQTCLEGVGECKREGQYVCKADASSAQCNAVAGMAGVEVCDNADNDCDDTIDEGLTQGTTCGVGACAGNTGIETCSAGAWSNNTCDPLFHATDETCDNADNDCDGETDEGDTCSTCNMPIGTVHCGEVMSGITDGENWLNNYSCKPGYPETGSEGVFVFNPGTSVKVTFKPININPSSTNLDTFILKDRCAADSCASMGYASATVTTVPVSIYYAVVDGYNGAAASFDLQVNCMEADCTNQVDDDADGNIDCADSDCASAVNCKVPEVCTDGLDNDADGNIDCADSDCRMATNCLPTCASAGQINCGQSVQGNTATSNSLMSAYSCAALDESGPETVYKFIAPYTGTAWVSLSGLSSQLDVFVLADACRANACTSWGNNSASFAMIEGDTYYVVVDGFAGASGGFTLSAVCQ
ncbi:MAG: hypothetical protein A2294_03295 [Candidatus Magasanikbacteria bacterium RIFOXYB2_FULL_38_10]|nr:MAG: hypothetical protein A2294_03295 [Candidatus Magasanikbacteria bacterium RIFOXYB2_FULL_38_10]